LSVSRSRAFAASGLAIAGLAVSVIVSGPALAVPAPVWTISQVLASPTGQANLTAVAATSHTNAWAGGSAGSYPYVERWNGQSWVDMTPSAAGFRTPGTQVAAIGSTGQADTWAVVSSATDGYAMGWNGAAWRKFSFHEYLTMTGIGVFSPRNVWAFGETGNSGPFARHYDGSRWRKVAMPAVPFAVSAPGPRQIWAVGPLTSTYLTTKPPRDVLMRWTGKAWSTVRLPGLGMTRTEQFIPTGMLAAGRNDIWVTGDIWRFPTGPLLQHKLLNWSGGKWHSYTAPASLGSIASDGTGGLWAAEIPGMPAPGAFAHFTRGTWQAVLAPLPPSPNPNEVAAVEALARVPGTTSLWAVGALATDGWDGIAYGYGP
jgi:hypothetical protein